MWAKLAAALAEPWYVRLGHAARLGTWKPVVPLAVAAMVIVAGFFMDHPADHAPLPGPTSTIAVSTSEADQVEQTLDDIQLLYQFESAAEGTTSRRQM